MDGTVHPAEDRIVFRAMQEFALFIVRLERAKIFYQFRQLFGFCGCGIHAKCCALLKIEGSQPS